MKRYINITAVDCEGSPKSTRLFTDSPIYGDKSEAVQKLRSWAHEHSQGTPGLLPLISAYIFDTKTKTLRKFDVYGNQISGWLRG